MGQSPTLQADSDVYRYLAGTQPVQPMGIAGPTPTVQGYGIQLHGSGAAFPGINGEVVPVQSNVKGAAASPPNLTASELGMIMKSLQAFVPEFPKLELGDASTPANRLLNWTTTVEQAINPAGPHVIQWWKWCRNQIADTSCGCNVYIHIYSYILTYIYFVHIYIYDYV